MLATFLQVHSNSKEVSYISWQNKYPNLKITYYIKPKFFMWTKLPKNLLLAKYLIYVATTLINKKYVLKKYWLNSQKNTSSMCHSLFYDKICSLLLLKNSLQAFAVFGLGHSKQNLKLILSNMKCTRVLLRKIFYTWKNFILPVNMKNQLFCWKVTKNIYVLFIYQKTERMNGPLFVH